MGDPVGGYGRRYVAGGWCMIQRFIDGNPNHRQFVFVAPRDPALGPPKIEAVPPLVPCHIDMGKLVCRQE